MGRHVIVGAGAVGRATARCLAELGHEVVVVTRRGAATGDARVAPVAADAADAAGLASVAAGADALYNCANPPYHRWAEEWPPLASSLLAVAGTTGAVLVTMSNLYGYGPVDHPLRTDDPLAATFTNGRIRASMWRDAEAAHTAGRVRATEARASDFFGPGTGATSHLGRALPRLLRGRPVRVLGDPDQPHSWTYVPDVGRTLAVLGTDGRAWGQPWHVPSPSPRTQRELLTAAAHEAGVDTPRVSRIPDVALRGIGLVSPMVRALSTVTYQFTAPFVIDAAETERTFGLAPTPWDDALRATVAAARSGQPA